jgi:hypothetical protein
MCVYVLITKVFLIEYMLCTIIPALYILHQLFDLNIMKALSSVPDTRIHHGMCSSTLPYATEKRFVIILYAEHLCGARRTELKSVHVMYHFHFHVIANV